ncbi:MAG: DUF6211 family protein [Actinoallomurus sp.]
MILHTVTRPRPLIGDALGLHSHNSAGADSRRTYRVSAQETPAGTYAIWHADPAVSQAPDWAAMIEPADVRYLIRVTPLGLLIWRCGCCPRN